MEKRRLSELVDKVLIIFYKSSLLEELASRFRGDLKETALSIKQSYEEIYMQVQT
ncbi:hypothetical protein [Lysinibacillus sp. FJAT-14745]|uniref:hypothetical protein n=1 Tax=Lysinibacillus sp. FJAT-14745 TaxID=1704289 RepID=UPI000A7F9197|nr:hypothetical protein [Lysinibacillus sp. FJAT-14745]